MDSLNEIQQNVNELKQMLFSGNQSEINSQVMPEHENQEIEREFLELEKETFSNEQVLLNECFEEIQRASTVMMQESNNAVEEQSEESQILRLNLIIDEMKKEFLILEEQNAELKRENSILSIELSESQEENLEIRDRYKQLLLRAKDIRSEYELLKDENEQLNNQIIEKNRILLEESSIKEELEAYEKGEEDIIKRLTLENDELNAEIANLQEQNKQLQIPQNIDANERIGMLMEQNKEFYDENQHLKEQMQDYEELTSKSVVENTEDASSNELEYRLRVIENLLRESEQREVEFASEQKIEEIQKETEINIREIIATLQDQFQRDLSNYDSGNYTVRDEEEVLKYLSNNIQLSILPNEERRGSLFFDGDSSNFNYSTSLSYIAFQQWLQHKK